MKQQANKAAGQAAKAEWLPCLICGEYETTPGQTLCAKCDAHVTPSTKETPMDDFPVPAADLLPGEAARLEYIRFEYAMVAVGMEPDPDPEDLAYLAELDAEHVNVTGRPLAPMEGAELAAWYAGRRAEVSALLGY